MGYINRPVAPLYTCRSFGDKFSATTEFLSANWRPLLRYITMFILPICLIQTFSIDKYMGISLSMADGAAGSGYADMVLYYLLLLIFGTIGAYLMFLTIYSFIRIHHHMTGSDAETYAQDDEAKHKVSWAQLRPLFKAQVIPLLNATAAGFIYAIAVAVVSIVIVVVLSLAASADVALVVGALLFVALMLCSIAIFSMLIPIFEFENPGIIAGLKQAARYGMQTFGGIMGMAIVFGIIVSVIGGLLSLPYFIFFIMKELFLLGDYDQLAFTDTLWYSFVQYVFGVIYLLVHYLLSSVMIVAMIYQYGHAKEKLDGASDEELTSF